MTRQYLPSFRGIAHAMRPESITTAESKGHDGFRVRAVARPGMTGRECARKTDGEGA
jgi:hypothetical protein